MDLFHGLTPIQIGAIKHLSEIRDYAPGKWIFRKGETTESLFVVVSGTVEIVKGGDQADEPAKIIARVEKGEAFGEIGLLDEAKERTASARAAKASTVLEIPRNPAQIFRSIEDHEAAILVMQNLICILGERLKHLNEQEARKDRQGSTDHEPVITAPARPVSIILHSLPKGILSRHFSTKTLKPEEYLCWEGDEPDGFYFVHTGELEVLKLDPQKALRPAGRMKAPTVVGELGFFTNEPRTACLRAIGEVTYTKFSGKNFEKLKKKDPGEAVRVVTAAAQMVAHLVVVHT